MSDTGFAIAWAGTAQCALRRLPEKVAVAAVEFIYGSLADTPQRVGKPLRYELAGLYSARRGDYRVIYRLNTEQRVIEIAAIEHRADVYRPHLDQGGPRNSGTARKGRDRGGAAVRGEP